jgi:hypothetical protein
MAVVQISKIQIRRDIKDASPSSDLPIKLSNGEFAWCIDTKQLYIGSSIIGSASQLENVEILTENSDIFSLGRYTYKNNGIFRSFTDRLEDRVSANDFGLLEGDNLSYASRNTDVLNALMEKLYIGTSNDSKNVIDIGPGIFIFDSTVQLPSFTRIQGAGKGNTILKYIGSGNVFESIHDDNNAIEIVNQCRNLSISNLTIEIVRPNPITQSYLDTPSVIFDLYGVTKCEFSNLELIGPLVTSAVVPDAIDSIAFRVDEPRNGNVNDLSPFTYTNLCSINNVTFKNFKIGFYASRPINKNSISESRFITLSQGVVLGSANSNEGPRHNLIKSCFFDNIEKQAVKIRQGYSNMCSSNNLLSVGNIYGGIQNAAYGQIEFDVPGNINLDYSSLRHKELSKYGANSLSTRPYVSEFTGYGLNQNFITQTKKITYSTNPVNFVRFPIPLSNTTGIGPESMSIEIDYLYQSKTFDTTSGSPAIYEKSRRIRKGTLTVIVDFRANTLTLPIINLYDDYEYIGYGLTTNATGNITPEDEKLIFRAVEQINSIQNQKEIVLTYQHQSLSVDQQPFEEGTLTYTYKVLT